MKAICGIGIGACKSLFLFIIILYTKKMKEEAKQQTTYEAPVVEIVEVEVEIGFCASGEPRHFDWGGDFSNN